MVSIGRSGRRSVSGAAGALLLTAALLLAPPAADAKRVPFVFDGTVDTIVQQGPWTYVAGTFTKAQAPVHGGLQMSDRGGARPAALRVTNPQSVAPDGAGGAFVLCSSPDRPGVPGTPEVRRLKPDGSLDALWSAGADGPVDAMLVLGGRLYLSGSFTHLGGQPRAGLGAVRVADGKVVPGWSPRATTAASPARSVADLAAAAGRTVYLTGSFTQVDGRARAGYAAVDALTGRLTPWRPPPSGDRLSVVAATTRAVYVTGGFTRLGGRVRRGVAALDPRTGAVTPWNPALRGEVKVRDEVDYVSGVVPAGPVVYLSGRFTSSHGRRHPGIVSVTTSTARPTRWRPAHSGPVTVLAAGHRHVYVLGRFRRGLSTPRVPRLAQLDPLTARATGWEPGITAGGGSLSAGAPAVRAVAVAGTRVYAVGAFYAAGPPLARLDHLARLRQDGSLDRTWRPRVGGGACGQPPRDAGTTSACVTSIVAEGGAVYLGGAFDAVGGRRRAGLAAVDAVAGGPLAWAPAVAGHAVPGAATPAAVYLIGAFSAVDGAARRGLAAVDPVSGTPTAWDAQVEGPTSSATMTGGVLYVAGAFTRAGGMARAGLVALEPATGHVLPWSPAGIAGAPQRLIPGASTLYVETRQDPAVGGAVASHLYGVDPATGVVSLDLPDLHGPILAAPLGGTLYLQSSDFFSTFLGSTGAVGTWEEPGLDYPYSDGSAAVYGRRALTSTGTRLALAGAFTQTYDGVVTGPFALYDPESKALLATTVDRP